MVFYPLLSSTNPFQAAVACRRQHVTVTVYITSHKHVHHNRPVQWAIDCIADGRVQAEDVVVPAPVCRRVCQPLHMHPVHLMEVSERMDAGA